MAFKEITTPKGIIIQGKNGKAELKWDPSFVPKTNRSLPGCRNSLILRCCEDAATEYLFKLERWKNPENWEPQ